MGVTFGAYHSRTNFKLDYIHKEIPAPEPKTASVSIPLVHGDIDLTERLTGPDPVFQNRELVFGFELRSMRSSWMSDYSDILSKIHGRILDVGLDEDPGYTWRGRVNVGPLEDHGFTAGITITVDAFPFKWKTTADGTYTYTLSGATTETINITTQIAKPVFTFSSSNSIEVTYDGQVFVATDVIGSPPGLLLHKGSSQSIKLDGTGAVTFKYYGGYL